MANGKPPFEVDDAIVILLGAPSKVSTLKDRVEGVTRLEKLIFLLEQESRLKDILTEKADFEPYNFGPFSSKIYKAVETLVKYGLLEDSAELSSSTEDSWETEEIVGTEHEPYATRNFSLTDRGRKYYKALLNELPKSTESEASDFKSRFGTLPLRQLIRYVYKKYPKYTENSQIKQEILG